MASFDKVIPPGGEGKITIQVRTKGYQGNVVKNARVYTNDPANEISSLVVKAFVKVPIFISSRYVYLAGTEGQEIERVVEIKAEEQKPLSLSPAQFDLEGKVKYTLEEVEKGHTFRVRFSNVAGNSDTYQGLLTLKTNYPESPEITIRIRGRFKKQISSTEDRAS